MVVALVDVRMKSWSYLLLWTIWKERNGVVFDDLVASTQRMKNSLIFALWSWAIANSNVQAVTVIDFLDTLVTM